MKKFSVLICATFMFLGSYGTSLGLPTVLYDDFNDGNLHPDWNVSFNYGAIGWDYTELGSSLTVTDIHEQSVIQVASGVRWPEITLSRSFSPVDDFQIDFDISWDSYNDAGVQSAAAMQFLIIKLYGESDNFLGIQSGYLDGWVGGKAVKHAIINIEVYQSLESSCKTSFL